MNEKIETGGPAFPHANPKYDGNWDDRAQIEGMTLRDYFAAKAMQSFLSNAPAGMQFGVNHYPNNANYAKAAYAMADAMLAARLAGDGE